MPLLPFTRSRRFSQIAPGKHAPLNLNYNIKFILLILLVLLAPLKSLALEAQVEEAGPFDICKKFNNIYYAVIDPNNFDYTYKKRLYVIKYYDQNDIYFRNNVINVIGRLITEASNTNTTNIIILYPDIKNIVNNISENELLNDIRAAGISAVDAKILAFNNSNITWVMVLVPNSSLDNVINNINIIYNISNKYVNVEYVVVIGGLWPENASLNYIEEVAIEVFDYLASKGLPLIGVGGAYGIPLIFSVNGIEMRELGLTESDVLEEIDNALPESLTAIVEIYYFNETLTFDVGKSENTNISIILVVLVLTVLAVILFTAVLRTRIFL